MPARAAAALARRRSRRRAQAGEYYLKLLALRVTPHQLLTRRLEDDHA
jgi:hypothetical protein